MPSQLYYNVTGCSFPLLLPYMTDKRLLSLLSKHQDNLCTEEELQELEQWYTQLDTGNQSLGHGEAASFSAEMLLNFRKRLGNAATVIPFYRKPYFRFAAAASVISIISVAFFFTFFRKGSEEKKLVKNTPTLPQEITSPKVSK